MSKAPLLQKLPLPSDGSIIFSRYETPHFETPWHFHEEYEIVLCDGGFGQKIVGNHSSTYKEGDLMLLGSNLPHWFKANALFYDTKQQSITKPASIVIQFKIDSFGQNFFDLAEFAPVKELLNNCSGGLEFFGPIKHQISNLLQQSLFQTPFYKMMAVFNVLTLMANTQEKQVLSDIGMVGVSAKDSARMGKIFEYAHENYIEPISLEDLSIKIGLSKAAFCRYFKARTQKTFVEYLSQIRLNKACELLQNTDKQIIDIAFEVGYTNLSNFNRQFKNRFLKSPKHYRKTINF